MADDVTVTVDPVQVARLQKALSELQIHTGRDCFQSVMYAAVKVSASARHDAKPGEKLRKLVANPEFTQSKRKRGLMTASRFAGYPFMFPIDTQAKGRRWRFTFDKQDPKREVPRHALSQIMWNNLSAAAAETSGPRIRGSKFTEFVARQTTEESAAEITNLLSYEETAYPGITNRAITKGVNSLNYQINKALGITVNRANRP